jgi:hypothetical protein
MTASLGFLWRPYTDLRTHLSASTNFQTWVSAATSTAALASIILFEAQAADITATRFCAILPPDDRGDVTLTRDTQGNGVAAFRVQSSLQLYFYADVAEWSEDAAIDFLNYVGLIINDILSTDNRYHLVTCEPRTKTPMRVKTAKADGSEQCGYQKVFQFETST